MRKQKKRSICVPDEEWAKAKRLAAASGRSISEYFRALLNLTPPKPMPPEVYHKAYRELSAIGNNLNQMAKLANMNQQADYTDFAEAVAVVKEVQKMLREAAYGSKEAK